MDISWLKANPVKILVNGDWVLSPFRITSLRKGDPTVLGTAKSTHRKSILWPTVYGGDVSKRNFERIHDRFQRDPENRASQLKIGWTE